MDLRYLGFDQQGNTRAYRFDCIAKGQPTKHLTITADIRLFSVHHIGIQEGPTLCAQKLTADLRNNAEGMHALPTTALARWRGLWHLDWRRGSLLACSSLRVRFSSFRSRGLVAGGPLPWSKDKVFFMPPDSHSSLWKTRVSEMSDALHNSFRLLTRAVPCDRYSH